MKMTKNDLHDALKHYFGFEAFKGHQEEIITSVINKENTFVIMPTGGGKSLCYQLPALVLEGTAIVISPLIALMKNQVDAMRGISSTDSIAHVLNSSLTKNEIREVMEDISNGKTKLLYVAPESLIKEEYANFLKTVPISFVAVDEAHCISEWGHDFRPEYRNIKTIIERLGSNIPIVALTATATPKVQEDILKNLGMLEANVFKSSFNRPNLYYEVRPKTKNVDADIIRFVKQNPKKSGIIYCLSRKKVEDLAQTLQVNGISAVPYHAGLDAKTRAKHQDMFLMEEVDVVVATIAFGMGIDKPDVRFVIHHDIPKSIESYYQETVIAAAREAQLDREKRSPFDTSSPNTFLGSLLGRFSHISTASSLFANLSHLTSITKNSFGSFLNQSTAKVYAADGSENFVTDTDLAGVNYQKIFSNESTCESLTNIGAACDMYGAEVTATDISVEKISSSDPEYQRVISKNVRKNAQGYDEVIPNSLLANKIMFCDERDSPFGHYDSNITNAFNISLGFANNIPIISDVVELVNAVSDMSPEAEGWGTGSFCVMGKSNPHWEEMKYLQHYIEQNRICTQIKCSSVTDSDGNDKNPITAYKEAYYAKNPIDTSRPGILARISGITKDQAKTVLALLDYATYLANYHPPKKEKATFTDQLKVKKTSTISSFTINKTIRLIYYADLKTITRNRSTLA